MKHAFAVILAGGKGERFWPLSTSQKPKQLLSLVGDTSLLAQAVDRLEGLIDPLDVLVITSADLVEATQKAAPQLLAENIMGEPLGRDTAAAVALACALVKKRDPEGAFCILTADHIIGDVDPFQATLKSSLELAQAEDVLITIGMEPNHPSTSYGYIESGDESHKSSTVSFYKAKRFVEKPDIDTAQQYLKQGTYYWNSGMFIWSVQSVEKALRMYCPPLIELMDQLEPVIDTGLFMGTLRNIYESLEKVSVDYAIMEKAHNIVMAKGSFSWDDVGAWPALENHFEQNEDHNVVIGEAQSIDASNNIIFSENRLTALVGVHDLVVVHADGATLVCPKDRAQDIKKLVEKLKTNGYNELL
ncbi:MAG: NTP transferase domain-containing protein [Kiritimatiellae bacterium]|nr:NTP transferase domain-containing protein [Kiritimatiellia bacterium]